MAGGAAGGGQRAAGGRSDHGGCRTSNTHPACSVAPEDGKGTQPLRQGIELPICVINL